VSIHTIPPDRFGHGRTRNLGASLARGEILVYLVQDAAPADEAFLQRLVAPLSRDPRVAATYARQVPRQDASPVESEFLRHTYPLRPSVRRLDEASGRATIAAVFFSNVASAIRRSVWERFPFDEDLIMSEDQEWARRVLHAGHGIAYCPDAVVVHSHGYPLGKVLRRNFDSGHSLVGVVHDRAPGMLAYELRFLASAAAGLVRRGNALWIPRLLVHEAVRATGFFLGRHSGLLPARWRRRLSLHRAYWKRRAPDEPC
jgi:rhamnosyltransferase